MLTENDGSLLTVVSLRDDLFALPVDDVQTMVMLPSVSTIPNMPPHVRGVFILRGAAVPVIDLRVRLGMPSLSLETEELVTMLSAREADHRNWLNELELSVKERRPFALTTDPHACAFGKWYDTFRTESLLLQGLLRKFDAPHRRIHAIAADVLTLEQAGDLNGAKKLLDKTRDGDLAEMLRLFELLRIQIRESLREIAVVLSSDGRTFAVAVDAVETVARLVEGGGADMADIGVSSMEEGLVRSVGKLDKSGRLVIVLDPDGIIGSVEQIPSH